MSSLKNIIYMDNNSTTKPHPIVFKKLNSDFLYGNPSSSHKLGKIARKALEKSRKEIAKHLKVKPKEIYFNSGASEGNNMIINGCLKGPKCNNKSHIITSSIEHASILKSCNNVSKKYGCVITFIPVDEHGFFIYDEIIGAITKNTVLVSLMLANNVIGTIQKDIISKVGEYLKDFPDIHFHCDATQMLGKYHINCKKLKVDSLTGSGHKFHALKGCGILYLKENSGIEPCITGGMQEFNMRAGTENVMSALSMSIAMNYNLNPKRYRVVHKKIKKMRDFIENELKKNILGIIVNGHPSKRLVNTLSICIPNYNSRKLVKTLSKYGICVNIGSACSLGKRDHVLTAIGVPMDLERGTLRISLSEYNTLKECELFVKTLLKLIKN